MKVLKKLKELYLSREFQRFFIAGITAFSADFFTLNFLIYIVKFNPYLRFLDTDKFEAGIFFANVISVIAGILVGFVINKYWAFKSNGNNVRSESVRYVAICMLNLVINNLIFGILVPIGIVEPIAKIITTGMQMTWTYLLYKFVVFKK